MNRPDQVAAAVSAAGAAWQHIVDAVEGDVVDGPGAARRVTAAVAAAYGDLDAPARIAFAQLSAVNLLVEARIVAVDGPYLRHLFRGAVTATPSPEGDPE